VPKLMPAKTACRLTLHAACHIRQLSVLPKGHSRLGTPIGSHIQDRGHHVESHMTVGMCCDSHSCHFSAAAVSLHCERPALAALSTSARSTAPDACSWHIAATAPRHEAGAGAALTACYELAARFALAARSGRSCSDLAVDAVHAVATPLGLVGPLLPSRRVPLAAVPLHQHLAQQRLLLLCKEPGVRVSISIPTLSSSVSRSCRHHEVRTGGCRAMSTRSAHLKFAML